MNTIDICEALYALPGGVVEARRRPIFKPAAAALAGAVLLMIDIIAVDSSSGNLDAGLLLLGSILFFGGAIAVAMRIFTGARTPYYKPDAAYLRRRERYYDRERLPELQRAVEAGDVEALDKIPESNVSAVTLLEYYSPKSGMRAFRIYAYAEFDRRAVSAVKIVGTACGRD